MIVSTSIDVDGTVTVTVDTDRDQGDCYSTDVLEDAAARAGSSAVTVWLAARRLADAEPSDEDDGGE